MREALGEMSRDKQPNKQIQRRKGDTKKEED